MGPTGREKLPEKAGNNPHRHCGRIIEFVNEEVERIQDRIASRHGFTLSRHRHELYGLCPDCQPRGKHAT